MTALIEVRRQLLQRAAFNRANATMHADPSVSLRAWVRAEAFEHAADIVQRAISDELSEVP